MKLFHLSDLHLGRKLKEFSLIEDQRHILAEILRAADSECPDGVIIAGDVYDKSTPGEDAIKLLDRFLSELAARKIKVFMISGNHDSADRVAFGVELMKYAGVYVSPAYDGEITSAELGDVVVYLMPYIKEYMVRAVFPEKEIKSITDAARAVVESIQPDKSKTNILVSHQFVTGTPDGDDIERTDDQVKTVGGVDNISAEVFGEFDYVALGHIHRPQRVAGKENIRYCGSPLKYTFDDVSLGKSITVLETSGKSVTTREIPLVPLHDLKVYEGTFEELANGGDDKNYVKLILTETGNHDARARLSRKYPLIADFGVTLPVNLSQGSGKGAKSLEGKTPLDLIKEFYTGQNGGEEMEPEMVKICEDILAGIVKEEDQCDR